MATSFYRWTTAFVGSALIVTADVLSSEPRAGLLSRKSGVESARAVEDVEAALPELRGYDTAAWLCLAAGWTLVSLAVVWPTEKAHTWLPRKAIVTVTLAALVAGSTAAKAHIDDLEWRGRRVEPWLSPTVSAVFAAASVLFGLHLGWDRDLSGLLRPGEDHWLSPGSPQNIRSIMGILAGVLVSAGKLVLVPRDRERLVTEGWGNVATGLSFVLLTTASIDPKFTFSPPPLEFT